MAAISILITAPIGAILMPLTAPYLLRQDIQSSQVLIERTNPKHSPKSNSAQSTNIINKKLHRSDQNIHHSNKSSQLNTVRNTKL